MRAKSQPVFSRPLLHALLLLAVPCREVRADNLITIMSHLKTFRDACRGLLIDTAATLKELGRNEEAAKMEQWSDDWLSILGVRKGLTGLTTEFVFSYLGHGAYHNHNGPLVKAITFVSQTFPKGNKQVSDEIAVQLQKGVIEITEAGLKIFEEGSSLNLMLKELNAIIKGTEAKYFAKGLRSNLEVKKAFEYMAGPRPDRSVSSRDSEL